MQMFNASSNLDLKADILHSKEAKTFALIYTALVIITLGPHIQPWMVLIVARESGAVEAHAP